MDLDGRAAVVSGAAAGIGRACAETLAARGARVLIADIDAEAAESVASSIGARSVIVDLSSTAGLRAVAGAVDRELGSLDVLIDIGVIHDEHRPPRR